MQRLLRALGFCEERTIFFAGEEKGVEQFPKKKNPSTAKTAEKKFSLRGAMRRK